MRAIGIILAGGNNHRMRELSQKRAIAAMPVAGSYRSIDFALSNMSNSHVQKVAVLTQYNSRSLNEHLSSSKWWDFGRKQGGLYLFTPTVEPWITITGTVERQMLFIRIWTGSNRAMNVCGHRIRRRHLQDGLWKSAGISIDKKADITVVCKEMPPGSRSEPIRSRKGR